MTLFFPMLEMILFVLSTIAINRYLNNYIKDSFLEDVFKLYKLGGGRVG